jgi:hypothetical protein
MKNLKKFILIAIVAVTTLTAKAVTPIETQGEYHSLLKPELEGTFTADQLKEKAEELYTQPSKSDEESIFQLGDDYARQIYDKILNKDFGNGRILSSAEKATIINHSHGESMPADYANNPSYEGVVERYDANGGVSSWTRKVTEGDQWLVCDDKPFIIVRCGNGYELTTLTTWKRAVKSNDNANAVATADVRVVIEDKRSPVQAAPVYNGDCIIKSFTANPIKIKCGDVSELSWTTDCRYVTISPLNGTFRPSGSTRVHPTESTEYILKTPGGSTQFVKVDVSHWFGRNAAWVVPSGLAIIGVGIDLACHHPAAAVTKDNSYKNGFQGGSGSSGAQGGTGGQTTWAVLHGSFALGLMHVTTVTGHQRSVAGFHFAIHL